MEGFEEYARSVLAQALKDLKEIDESGGWEIFSRGKKVEKMRKPSEVLFLIRGVCEVPLSFEEVRDFLRKPTSRVKYITDMTNVDEVLIFGDGVSITRNTIKTPPGVSDRDAVTVNGMCEDQDECFYIAERSVEYPPLPPQDGFIRSNLLLSGFVVRPIGPRSTVLSYVFNLDPRGALPEAFVNFVQKEQAKVPGIVRELMKNGER